MTPKQERFVEEYLVDLNAARAARRAGYGVRAAANGYRLLQSPEVASAVAAAKRARALRAEISADRVLAEYARIAFADISRFAQFGPDGVTLVDMAALSPAETAAIAEVSESKTQHGGVVRFKLHDKLAALHALARHIGLNAPEKVALTDAAGADVPAIDAYAIARQIAFALRRGEVGRENAVKANKSST